MFGTKTRRIRAQADTIARLHDQLEDALDERDRMVSANGRLAWRCGDYHDETTALEARLNQAVAEAASYRQQLTEEGTAVPHINRRRYNALRRVANTAVRYRDERDQYAAKVAEQETVARALRKRILDLHDHCAAIESRLAYLTACNQAMEFELAVERGLPINPQAKVAALPSTAGCEQ